MEIVTDVNKKYGHMFFYSTCMYHVCMSEDINLF